MTETAEQTTPTTTPTPETPARTPMWLPDEPVDMTDPPETPDTPEAAADPTDPEPPAAEAAAPEAEAEGEAPEQNEPANPDESRSGHDFDKGLQRMQQRQATLERNLERVSQTLESIADRLPAPANDQQAVQANQPGADAPAASQAEQAEAVTDVESLLSELQVEAEGEADDFPTRAELQQRDQRIKSVLGKLVSAFGQSSPVVSELQQQVQTLQSQLQEHQQAVDASRAEGEQAKWFDDFNAAHGFDGRGKWSEISTQVETEYPGADEQTLLGIASDRFKQWVIQEKARQGQQTAPKAADTPAPRRTPRQSTEGTQTVPASASSQRPSTDKRQYRKPPMWTPD